MIGRSLEQICRAVVRPETFEITVAPAIADLQHEARLGTWARVRGYVSVWRVLCIAIALEIGGDCAATLRAACLREAITPALASAVFTYAFTTPWGIWLGVGRLAHWQHDVALLARLLPGTLAITLPVVAMPIGARLAQVGMPGAFRSAVLLAAAGVSGLVCASAVAAGSELRDTAALIVTTIAFAMVGAARSGRRRWATAALACAVVFAVAALRMLFYRVLYVQIVFGQVITMWAVVSLFFLAASLVAVRARPTQRT